MVSKSGVFGVLLIFSKSVTPCVRGALLPMTTKTRFLTTFDHPVFTTVKTVNFVKNHVRHRGLGHGFGTLVSNVPKVAKPVF